MTKRESFFLLHLLLAAQSFQLVFEQGDLAIEALQPDRPFIELALLVLHHDDQLAQLTLQRQRSAAALLSAAQRVAVIADAVGQQEVKMWILAGQPSRRGAILGDEAAGQAREQILSSIAQPVHHWRHPEHQ